MLSNIIIEFTEEQIELLKDFLNEAAGYHVYSDEADELLAYIEEVVAKTYSLTPIEENTQSSPGHGMDIEINTDTFDSTFLANDPLKW